MYLAYVLLDGMFTVRQVCDGGENKGRVSSACLDAFNHGKQTKDSIFNALSNDVSSME